MLVEESLWIKNILDAFFKSENYPLLNIGSSTEHFRKSVQPHINQNIFLPLKNQGKTVFHTDIKDDTGVDIVGDLNKPEFRDHLRNKGIKSVLCSNLLEHLEKPQTICNSILDLVKPGDYIIVTVPYQFPFHKDPIDTLLRPGIEELHKFFPGTDMVQADIIKTNRSYRKDLFANKKYLMIMIIRWLLPVYKFREWRLMIRDLFQCNKNYSATCILLRKR